MANAFFFENNAELSKSGYASACFMAYLIISMISLFVYSTIFGLVFLRKTEAGPKCALLQFGRKSLFLLSFPIICALFHVLDSILLEVGYQRGQLAGFAEEMSIIMLLVVSANVFILNLFMLKIAGIAAMMRCQTQEEDFATLKLIKWAYIIYLPLYVVAFWSTKLIQTYVIGTLQESKEVQSKFVLTFFIVLLNAIKILLTLCVVIYSFRFWIQLRRILRQAETDVSYDGEQMAYLKISKFYVLLMTCCFLFANLVRSVLQPAFLLFFLQQKPSDFNFTNALATSSLFGGIYLVNSLACQVVVLLFYNRSAAQENKRTSLTDTDHVDFEGESMRSGNTISSHAVKRVTLYSSSDSMMVDDEGAGGEADTSVQHNIII